MYASRFWSVLASVLCLHMQLIFLWDDLLKHLRAIHFAISIATWNSLYTAEQRQTCTFDRGSLRWSLQICMFCYWYKDGYEGHQAQGISATGLLSNIILEDRSSSSVLRTKALRSTWIGSRDSRNVVGHLSNSERSQTTRKHLGRRHVPITNASCYQTLSTPNWILSGFACWQEGFWRPPSHQTSCKLSLCFDSSP